MNLTRLKTYAPAARNALITAVTRRAGTLGIQAGRVEAVTESGDVALIGGHPFPRSIVPLRKQLLDLIQRDGFDHTMEAMAYTWFNRLVALRFMELHDGYLDHGYRVLSHPQGNPLPEILQHAEHVSLKGLDREEVIRLKLDGNRDEELYRLLLLAQCAELNHILPDVFSKLDDATILLLPDNLLHSDSVIRQLVAGSDAEDWQQVEVLGWLYQFYISEKKDAVMARKSAVLTEDIPAVTQLFTPHWIVRYLVENSLGRLWLLNRPNSRLRDHMPYYIEGEQETDFLKITKPEDIKLLDPAVGSGHMLTYAFDLLTLIYEEEGYAANDIPGLILKHNLHGLDLCPRAAQLAELALVFKAREKSRRFFTPGNLVRPNIIELQDVRFAENELHDYISALRLGNIFQHTTLTLLHQFEDAKNFGSLIQPCIPEPAILELRRIVEEKDLGDQLFLRETHLKVLRVLEQAEALTQRYHVVVANPPYMGSRQMNGELRAFAQDRFAEAKADLFSMFISRGLTLTMHRGYASMITMQSWMFLSSFEDFRDVLIKKSAIVAMAHLGARAFDSIAGEVVQTTAFVLINEALENLKGSYLSLINERNESEKESKILQFNMDPGCDDVFHVSSRDLKGVPSCPIAYWISKDTRELLASSISTLSETLNPRQGMATGNNDVYLRLWHEISHAKMAVSASSKEEAWEASAPEVYVPYNKGGTFRKWYGNRWYVLRFSETDYHKLKKSGNNCPSEKYYFREGITWSDIVGITFAARHNPPGSVFDVKGSCGFPEDEKITTLTLGFLNSRVTSYFKRIFNPSTTFQVGDISKIPVAIQANEILEKNGGECILRARVDWDNFETSWDFCDLPLLRSGDWEVDSSQPGGKWKGITLAESWTNYAKYCNASIRRMKELESENNRIWIDAYGLQKELSPDVPGEEITLARADASSDMCAFLSYAVGCMMGRYSLDHPGLILANAGDTLREFLDKVGKPLAELAFAPDEDGIIPVLDGEWFEDNIIARTKDFLRTTFGEATLSENLRFIEESLGKDLRTYFLNDFYRDHLQTYKNRPIYWLFSSGKQKAFQCLVYLHRYSTGTLARIRTEYVIPLQGKLSARITRLEEEVTQTSSSAARKNLQTELDKSKKQMVELLAFDEQLRSYADQAITLDLDDGVKTNYAKFGPLVAESKKVCGTKED